MDIHLTISSTGVAYLFLFVSVVFLAYRFFQYWRKSMDTTSKAFFFFSLSLSLLAFVRAASGLFFANNLEILALTVPLVSFCQALMGAIAVFIVIRLKFSKISPWAGFMLIFILGMISTMVTISDLPYREISLGQFSAINWGLPSKGFIYSLLRMIVLAFAFLPLSIIMIQQGMVAGEPHLKKRSYGLGMVLILGIIIGVLDYFFVEMMRFDAIIRDIMLAILSVFLFFITFYTQKSPSLAEKT